jgi:hypothetical protein
MLSLLKFIFGVAVLDQGFRGYRATLAGADLKRDSPSLAGDDDGEVSIRGRSRPFAPRCT